MRVQKCYMMLDTINGLPGRIAKDGVKLDQLGFLRTEIRKIKTNDAYTVAIGKDWRIISTNDELDEETAKPKFSGQAFPNLIGS